MGRTQGSLILRHVRKFSAVFGTMSAYSWKTTLPAGLPAMVMSKYVSGRCFPSVAIMSSNIHGDVYDEAEDEKEAAEDSCAP